MAASAGVADLEPQPWIWRIWRQVDTRVFGNVFKLWDMAAGMTIVREAGGFVSDFKGRDNALATGGSCGEQRTPYPFGSFSVPRDGASITCQQESDPVVRQRRLWLGGRILGQSMLTRALKDCCMSEVQRAVWFLCWHGQKYGVWLGSSISSARRQRGDLAQATSSILST